MSVSILEALQNAELNLIENRGHAFAFMLGKDQLHNAISLLEKGYGPNECFDEIVDRHGSVVDVPDKSPTKPNEN